MNILQQIEKQKLITPPSFLSLNTHYLCTMGSQAYGVSTAESDHDIYGFAIPPKGYLFSHLEGYIDGFGHNPLKFEQYQQVGISYNKKDYDFTIYSIVKYFELCRQGNPNMIDSLFVPQDCILLATQIGQMVLDNRRLFVSKDCFQKYKGYSYSQLHKLQNKDNRTGKRVELIEKHSFDSKFGYHLVRLLNEIEQLLMFGEMDLRRDREMLKSIRRGEWTEQDILEYFDTKSKHLEKLYAECKLPDKAPEAKLRQLLIDCLEQHYGDLSAVVGKGDKHKLIVDEIRKLVN